MTTAPTRKDSIKVGIAEPRPTHDISLTDNKGNQVGLILTNRLGVRDPKGILEGNMPRTALRTSQGNVGYDDLELPFTAEVQNTMVGGRAQEDLARDRTKYSDAFRMDTTKEFPICGPAAIAQTGLIATDIATGTYKDRYTPENIQVMTYKFDAATDITGFTINYRKILQLGEGTDFNYYFYYWYGQAAAPNTANWGAMMVSADGIYMDMPPTDFEYRDLFVPLPGGSYTITSGNYFTIALRTIRAPLLPGGNYDTWAQVSRYTCAAADLYTANIDGSMTLTTADTIHIKTIHVSVENDTIFFEYKRQLYALLNETDKSTATLFMNGWRGAADSNAANLSTLVDATQDWGTAAAGCVVLITNGKGENEDQPWRNVVSSVNHVLTVSPPWKIAHDTTTEYVVLDSNVWTVVATLNGATDVLGKAVTDVAVTNEMAIFAKGAAEKIAYMREYNSSGTWTKEYKLDPTYYADFLEPIVDEEGELYLWRAIADGAQVDRSKIYPYTYGAPLVFDINKKLRDELELSITRAESDKVRELAKDDNLIPDEIYLIRQYDDLTTEHNRILTQYAAETDTDKKADLADRDEDIWTIKKRLAGSNKSTWDDAYMTTPTDVKYGNADSIAHNAMFGSATAAAGSDIAKAVASTDDVVDEGYLITLERLIEDARWQAGDATSHDPIVNHEDVYLKKYLVCGSTDSRITNLVPYGTPTIPYIIKEDSLGSIQSAIYDEVPISELKAVRSEENGIAAMAYGVYLYFSMEGNMIERYYDQRLDDIGPNRADGLPKIRQGVIRKMIPYPGRFYISIDAGFNGYSSILCSNELGWHEIYRSPAIGRSIKDIYVQTIPGDNNSDRLWVSEGVDTVKLPIAINPLNQDNYQYFGYGSTTLPSIETSWIDYGMKDVNKYFHSVTLFADYPAGKLVTGREFDIIVSYRLSENDDWKLAGKTSGSGQFPQEIELDHLNHNVSGKKIQLKFEFKINSDTYHTPRLKAWVLNGILRMPVKKSWQLTFALEPAEDLQDRKLLNPRHTLIDQLNTWANSKVHNTPLVMRTCDRQTDNKLVFIDPASVSLINVVLEQNRGNTIKQFDHLASLTVYEV